jgi:hypothetical protein
MHTTQWIIVGLIALADLLLVAFIHSADTRRNHPEWS